MNTSQNIIDHLVSQYFGGQLGTFAKWVERPQQTVSSWKSSNSVPQSMQRFILKKSDKEGLGIKPVDFFPERLSSPEEAVA